MAPPDVQLVDRVVDVVRQFDVLGGRTAALVVVGRDVRAERLDGAQTVPRDHFSRYFRKSQKLTNRQLIRKRTSFAFCDLDADVVLLGTPLSGVPVPVERRAAARVRRHASVAVGSGAT